ncbi:hypothetical protein KEM54_002779 [Ascosphaera aggregata]|nr:hypothetical protein KEM54_002779 [Ascosphaera aggregata]
MSTSRPKRHSFDYPGLSGLAYQPSSKKPRFDVRNPSKLATEEEDVDQEDIDYLDADAIGRRGQRVKRNAVNVEGYESDSENEEFHARAERLARERKKGAKNDNDEDDMFAVDEDELAEDFGFKKEESEHKKKQVKFMEDRDIEGQEKKSRGGHSLHVDFRAAAESRDRKGKGIAKAGSDDEASSESSESEVDDEIRAAIDGTVDKEIGAGGKKQHAPLIDAFNMRAEQQEGRFDEAGNYVRNAVDPNAVYDSWLDGVSKKDVRKARAAHEKREEDRRRQAIEDDKVLTADLLSGLITNLERGETPLEALARLNKRHKKVPKWQNKHWNKTKRGPDGTGSRREAETVNSGLAEDQAEAARKKTIDEITTSSDGLLARGHMNIYDTEREVLTRQFRRETGRDWVNPNTQKEQTEEQATVPTILNTTTWEFRWSDGRDGGGAHGPYDAATMQQWVAAGYFGEGVEFRKAGNDEEWTKTATFL